MTKIILIGGDIIFGKGVSQIVRARGIGYLFEPIAPLLRSADWTILNMEGCINTRGAPQDKEYTFRAPPELARHLRLAGVSMVSLGNNHSMDYGKGALLDTMEHLWRAGVWWAGAGANQKQAIQPVYVDFGSMRIAVICFTAVVPRGFPAGEQTPGVATLSDVLPLLPDARANADLLIAIPHWGDEGKTQPNAKQKRIARLLANAGVDLIVGHHPHVVQGYERVGKAHVFYSVGNFIHTPRSNLSRRAVLTRIEIDRRGVRALTTVPLRLEGGRPIPQVSLRGEFQQQEYWLE
ncbi:MAG: CapA family protein [Fimbriimonadales bacterium]|nr:CapA family protein [Fimbriimonadales bacterium]